jgi:hypothetical protein
MCAQKPRSRATGPKNGPKPSFCAPGATSGKCCLKSGFRPGGPPEGRRRRLWPALEEQSALRARIRQPWLRHYGPAGGHDGSYSNGGAKQQAVRACGDKTRWCVTQHKKRKYSLKNRSPRDRDWVALPTFGGLSSSAKSSGSVFPLRFFTVVETLRRPVLILAWLQTASSIEDGLLDRRSPCASFAWAN